jgi:ubiquinone/menaquinone biosynthesis C-methylase UbiE
MPVVQERVGDYPIERRKGEVERLQVQSAALAAEAERMLDAIGVGPGWSCLDLGCGPRGVTDLLSARVAPAGRVVGLDYDPAFVEIASLAPPALTEYVRGDAYATGLPEGSFDLVHVRFLACTGGQPERLIAEALRLARAGGTVAFQEADFQSLRCYPPHPAWETLRAALAACFPESDGEPIAQRLYRLLRHAGALDVHFRPVVIGTRAGEAWSDYLPATVDSVRSTITARALVPEGGLDAMLAECRSHLADPDTVQVSYTIVQVWGRKPS